MSTLTPQQWEDLHVVHNHIPKNSHPLFQKDTFRYYDVWIDIEVSKITDAPLYQIQTPSRLWTIHRLAELGLLNFPYYMFPDMDNDSPDRRDYIIHLRTILPLKAGQLTKLEALPYVNNVHVTACTKNGVALDWDGNTIL